MKKTLKKLLYGMVVPLVIAGSLNAQSVKPKTIDDVAAKDSELSINFIAPAKNKKENIAISISQIFQASALIYEDIRMTKIGRERYGELNPIANKFWEKDLWELGYVSAIGGLVLGNYICNRIDKTGNLSSVFNSVVSLIEIYCIKENNKFMKGEDKRNLEFKINFYKSLEKNNE